IIPEGNYGAGTVMVWDVGTWEPLSPQAVEGKYLAGSDAEAAAMLQKGDLKFRLHGQRLKGDFALVHIKSRRPGTKGTEWLMIKKHDGNVVEGFDIDGYDTSVLSAKTMAQIGGDEGAAQWQSDKKASRGKVKAAWLADTLARVEKKKKSEPARSAEKKPAARKKNLKSDRSASDDKAKNLAAVSAVKPWVGEDLQGAVKRPMPTAIYPMLAAISEHPFDDPDWLFEIKWDGYRVVAFLEKGGLPLGSRNQ